MNGVSTKSAAVSHMRMVTMNISSAIGSSITMAYSAASASAGSILVTRHAGRKLAARLASASVATTAANTVASRGST